MNRITGLLKSILLSGALLYLVAFFTVVFLRINYPFELEWMEGGMLDHVKRILDGKRLYAHPSLEFTSYIYGPLYFYVAALLTDVSDNMFFALRLVSVISSLGCLFFIYLIVFSETGNKFAGIIASCLFVATFRLSGAWLDLGRVDPLFLFFLLTALYLVKFKVSVKSYVFAGIFFTLAFLTKQTALVIFLPVMLYCFIINWRYGVIIACTSALLMGGSNLIINHLHDGWYNFYLFELPAQHQLLKGMILDYWIRDILSPLLIAFVISIFYIVIQFLNSNREDFLFYSMLAVGMLGASWASRIHIGGAENVLLPAYVAISIMFGLGINSFVEFIKPFPVNKSKMLAVIFYSACIIQFASGPIRYNPFDQVPSREDMEAGKKLVATLSESEGDVFIPDHTYLSSIAGKSSYAHRVALGDVLKGSERYVKKVLADEIMESIRQKRFSMIILDGFEPFWQKDIEKYYKLSGRVFEDTTTFMPVTGITKRPELIYVPKDF